MRRNNRRKIFNITNQKETQTKETERKVLTNLKKNERSNKGEERSENVSRKFAVLPPTVLLSPKTQFSSKYFFYQTLLTKYCRPLCIRT